MAEKRVSPSASWRKAAARCAPSWKASARLARAALAACRRDGTGQHPACQLCPQGRDRALIDNLGRLATYAATFAAFMAGRWVAGLAAAALSVRGLATALVILRGALIRTGIGALIVGAGELVYQFSQLVARVGGVGEAFRLLGDLAREVWSRIGLVARRRIRQHGGWLGGAEGGRAIGAGRHHRGRVSFGDRTAAIFQGAYDAAVAIWGSLPGAIGDFAFQAANGLISRRRGDAERRRHPHQQLHQRAERRAGPAARMGHRRRRGADRHAGSGGTGPDRQPVRGISNRCWRCRRRCLLGRAVADLSDPPDLGLARWPTMRAPGPTAIARPPACWPMPPVVRWPAGRR
jgi:hypothetical protein